MDVMTSIDRTVDNKLRSIGKQILTDNIRELKALIAERDVQRDRIINDVRRKISNQQEQEVWIEFELMAQMGEGPDDLLKYHQPDVYTTEQLRTELKHKKARLDIMFGRMNPNGNIEQAKQRLITDFMDFNKGGFAKCIWHTDKTASMKYYPLTNAVWCYGCNKGGDVIDVVRQLTGQGFREVVHSLCGGT